MMILERRVDCICRTSRSHWSSFDR